MKRCLVLFDAPFDKGQSFGHDAIVEHGDFAGGYFECMEKFFACFHPFLWKEESGATRPRERSVSGTRVPFDLLAPVGFS